MKSDKQSRSFNSFKEIKAEKIYPYISRECHIHTTPFESWLFYPGEKSNPSLFQTYEVLKIDHADEEIIFSCDGKTSLKNILKVLRQVYGIPEQKIYFTLDSLLHKQILSFAFEPMFSLTFPSFGGSRDYFVPLHLFLELTDACNQLCQHCYRESSPNRNSFMDKENFAGLVETLGLEGTLVAEFTGGEPLLHPDFLEMLALASEYMETISIITNGTLIDEKIIRTIKELSQQGSKILVSLTLNSHLEEKHDNFVGFKGSYQMVLRSLRHLSAAGIPVRVSMNLTRYNLEDMQPTAELALNNGASVFAAAPVNEEGRAREKDFCLKENNEWEAFDRAFLALKRAYPEKVFVLPEPVLNEIYHYSCGAGTRTIAISPDGRVRPCVLFEEHFSLGNIFNEGIERVLAPERIGFLARSLGPKTLGCSRCPHFTDCNGCLRRMIKKARSVESCSLKNVIETGRQQC
jgi:radical SAM protein with 4Fe4S-binding SPASM domain